jgi:RNA polymerase sigma-70 factor, ECF subfamily
VSGAVRTNPEEFTELTGGYRPELLAHCYRMLGSVHEAEDLVQDTYLRAWRSFDSFEGRSSVRVWLYRIATNACLSALGHRSRRVLPAGIGAPGEDPDRPLTLAGPEVDWVQPLPDARLVDPATAATARDTVRLAMIAALQHLPPRQRAALILRDVLGWPAAEAAELLGLSTDALTSALARARGGLARARLTEESAGVRATPAERALADRYAAAFESGDIDGLLRLLRADVVLEMPPQLTWFTGSDAVGRFLAARVREYAGRLRMLPTWANGQPALAKYVRDADGAYRPHNLHLLSGTADGIGHIVAYNEPELFVDFGLPQAL